MLIRKIKEIARTEFDNTVRNRRELHAHPEVSFHEEHTCAYIREKLCEAGISSRKCGDYGLIARVYGEKPGPCIAFRAEFDGLPVLEKSGAAYASENTGVMHACGHDGHTAILLSLARTMQANRELIEGEAVFIFQYAEEIPPGGALTMIREGCLEGVDKIYGLHVSDELDTGIIGICRGNYMAATDGFFVDITGSGGHGSRPDEMQDTISAAVEAIQLSNDIVSRFISPSDFAVVSTCRINGGHSYNVLPTTVQYEGTVRTYDPQVAMAIRKKLELSVKCACAMFGTDFTFRYEQSYPPLYNHDAECALIETAAAHLGLSCVCIRPTPVGEDFSRYLQIIPGAFFRLGIRNPALNAIYPLHDCRFNMDEAALQVGLELFWSIFLSEIGRLQS